MLSLTKEGDSTLTLEAVTTCLLAKLRGLALWRLLGLGPWGLHGRGQPRALAPCHASRPGGFQGRRALDGVGGLDCSEAGEGIMQSGLLGQPA